MTNQQQALIQGWAAVAEGCQQALGWVDTVRVGSRRLENEADKLNLSLLRTRNLATTLTDVAGTPMTVGIFGISQAGKSYLISALAADSSGGLEALYGDQRIDFIQQVNPVGGGKEATGLVTRFTAQAPVAPADYPVPLRLFSEIDLAKILANTWFNDFNHEQLSYQLDQSRIDACLQPFLQRATQPTANNGVSREDVVALWDYLNASFKKSVEKLEHAYWPQVLKIAPALTSGERAELFSLLWGEQPALTETYRTLARVLEKLNHASLVFAPLPTLIDHSHGSIMNVDSINRLGSGEDRQVEIGYWKEDQQLARTTLLQAELTALTAELIFPLAEVSDGSVMTQMDLLDFPGYRGRLKITALEEAGREGLNPISQLLLRGKVAYLFERYTDNQEMDALVVCASSAKQSDVADVGPVLNRWVEKTQGKNAQQREARQPGLFWAITMCDMRINNSLKLSEAQLKEGWEGMLHMTLLERFGQYDWLQQWTPGKPFNNCFLVRKPGLDNPFLTLEPVAGSEEKLHEVAFAERYQGVLDQMGATFISGKNVRCHVAEPQMAWQAMLKLNDGGISRLTTALQGVAHLDFKLQHLHAQLLQYREEIGEQKLGRWYERDGDGQQARKQEIAKVLWQSLSENTHNIGELIYRLALPVHELDNIYLSIRDQQQTSPTTEDAPAQPLLAANPFGANPFAQEATRSAETDTASAMGATVLPPGSSLDDEFAHQVFTAWIAHLRELAQQGAYWAPPGLSAESLNLLSEELITAASRQDLENTLRQVLAGQQQINTRREQLMARQVLRAQLTISDFIAWFGYLTLPAEQIPASYLGDKEKVFSKKMALTSDGLPQLPSVAATPGIAYIGDWVSALMTQILNNAGHSATRDISFEQNRQLGQIISHLKQESVSC